MNEMPKMVLYENGIMNSIKCTLLSYPIRDTYIMSEFLMILTGPLIELSSIRSTLLYTDHVNTVSNKQVLICTLNNLSDTLNLYQPEY